MAEEAEDFSSLPLPDRFAHKNWKVRKEGYEDAAKQFEKTADEADPVFRPFLQDPGLLKGAAADTNVAAQQEGLAALCAFLRYGGREHAVRTRAGTLPPIVEKGLASTRPAIKASAVEALLQYVELDRAEPVLDDLLPALAHKQPKVVAAALAACTALFHNYGVKIVDPKPVLKAVPKCFGHADKNVRAEASNLVVELYRWLREAIKTLFWSELKPVQQTDLEKLFEAVKLEPPPKQERLLRSQQAAPEAPAAATDAGEEDVEEAEDAGGMDAYDLAEPVDVLSKMPKDFQENMNSSKWKDRKEALDALYNVAHVDRIKDGPYDDIMAILAKCMKDANIAVVTVAANCVEVLAKGLRRGFARYRGKIMAPLLERLKEKKQAVADALGAALDAVCAATSLSECLEETMEFLKHKNPQVKLETLRFLIRGLRTTREAPSPAEAKTIADAATKMLTESTEVARAGGAEVLGTLMKIMGERAMNPYLEGLDDIRKTKIREFFDVAEVKAKNKPKPAPPPKAAAAAPAAQRKAVGKKPGAAPMGLKKTTARPATPQEDPPTPAPAPKSVQRPGLGSKLGGPGKSGLAAPSAGGVSGLRLQKPKLAGPGGAAPPRLASPKRSITPQDDDIPAATTPAPRIGGPGGRSLAGRPLSKPAPAQPHPLSPPAHAPAAPGLGALERAELAELRAANARLQALAEELRAEKGGLEVQLGALRTHEAELIEERTRDRLALRAKETQLVRARSDAEAAEDARKALAREGDRLRRELQRAVRAASPPPGPPPPYAMGPSGRDVSEQIYRDSGAGAGRAAAAQAAQAGPGAGRITPAALDRYESNRVSREIGYQRARGYMGSPSEEKENSEDGPGAPAGGRKASLGSGASSARLQRELSSGDGSPSRARQLNGDGGGGAFARGAAGGDGAGAGGGGGGGHEPIENWRRAAEVTSQLKARIEQMKARQAAAKH